ncbi:hypothetical protein [Runella sp.]|uniref:hypothetical protein n=1 Tax=Runella sp. TaxID=1960881 RepID=UPI00301AF5B1
METKTTEQLLFDFTASSLQVMKLSKEIKKLNDLREMAQANAQESFDLYHDRLKQNGEDIEIPDPAQEIEKVLRKKPV